MFPFLSPLLTLFSGGIGASTFKLLGVISLVIASFFFGSSYTQKSCDAARVTKENEELQDLTDQLELNAALYKEEVQRSRDIAASLDKTQRELVVTRTKLAKSISKLPPVYLEGKVPNEIPKPIPPAIITTAFVSMFDTLIALSYPGTTADSIPRCIYDETRTTPSDPACLHRESIDLDGLLKFMNSYTEWCGVNATQLEALRKWIETNPRIQNATPSDN